MEPMGQVDEQQLFEEPTVQQGVNKRSRQGRIGRGGEVKAAGEGSRKEKMMWPRIQPPVNDNDWLAMYADEPQSLQDYMNVVTLRSGRFSPSHFGGASTSPKHFIGLVPIIRTTEQLGSSQAPSWPAHGPDLQALAKLTELYFDRPVRLLPCATLRLGSVDSKKPGGFSGFCTFTHARTGVQGKFKRIRLTAPSNSTEDTRRLQVHVDPLLSHMCAIRESMHQDVKECFCVMGVTMEDLYSANSDLFVAGMAAGGSNVAVFSFHRYHPCLKMDPGDWWDYGYTSRPSDYSYFEDGKKRPAISHSPPQPTSSLSSSTSGPHARLEVQRSRSMLRRAGKYIRPRSATAAGARSLLKLLVMPILNSPICTKTSPPGKLLVHELMHLYGIDHCVFRECIMRGTGHLVEDFAAPFELCPVDLRKMQWRLSFDVIGRYRGLRDFFAAHGLAEEVRWLDRRLRHLEDTPSAGAQEPNSDGHCPGQTRYEDAVGQKRRARPYPGSHGVQGAMPPEVIDLTQG